MQVKYLLFIFGLLSLWVHHPLWTQAMEADTGGPPHQTARTKDGQLRQIQIDQAKLQMELAQKLMEKKYDELKNLRNMLQEANNIVTVQEVNRAEEEYERAKATYEGAKLNLQNVELDSLKDAWHITNNSQHPTL